MAFSRVLRMKPLLNHRLFCSITQPDSAIHKQKIQSALSHLRSQNNSKNPAEQILYGCLSNTISILPPPSPSNTIHSFLHELDTEPALMSSFLEELKTQPDFRKERMFSHIITVYGQAGMFPSAKKTFEEMPAKGIVRSAESLNALLGAALHTRSKSRILEAYRIFTDYPTIYGITRNVETYNLLLKAWVHNKSLGLIFTVLNVMNNEGCKPDETIYRTILAGLSEVTPEETVKVFEYMDKRNIFLENIDIYNFGIQNLCKLKKPAEAKKLFEKITSRGMQPNSVTYQHLISSFTSEGDVEEVKRLTQDMRQKGIELDRDCYEDNETALLNKGNVKEMKGITEEICENSVEISALRHKAFIKNMSQIGDPEVAYLLCKESMKEEWFPRFLSSAPRYLKSLVEKLLCDSRQEDVRELLGRMDNLGLLPSLDIYNFVIQELYYLESDDAMEFFQLASNRGVKLNLETYWSVIKGLSSCVPKTDKMKSVFYEMIEKGVEPDQRICSQLMQDLCEWKEDYKAAFLVCKECMSMTWFPNFISTDKVFNELVEGLVENSFFDVVKELLDIMKKHGSSQLSEIYSTTLDEICTKDEGGLAKDIYKRASSLNIKLNKETYRSLVELFSKSGSMEELEKVLSDMSDKGVEIGFDCYENIIKPLRDADKGVKLETVLRVTYECMSKEWFADFLSEDTSTIETLVNQLKKESRYEEVWKLLEAMKKNGLQTNLTFFFQ